jgi:Beta protein
MPTYVPIIRSRAAELKGLKELTPEVLDAILPVVEFTRSRRTAKNPGGSVRQSVTNVGEILGERPFIADLTSLESQQNSEVNDLLNDANNFGNWTTFALDVLPAHAVPVVHLLDPFVPAEFVAQLGALRDRFPQVALRFPAGYGYVQQAMAACVAGGTSLDRVAVVLDAGFVTRSTAAAAATGLQTLLTDLTGLTPWFVSAASSSFPNSVVSAGGGDDTGAFPLIETSLHAALARQFPFLVYGDYAAIHPEDFVGTVTNWVPRVDVMLGTEFYYYRYRRSDGGYIRAASEAQADHRFVSLNCWATRNIAAAAAGAPMGKSPSHWIASRLNFHVSRQVDRLTL